MHLLSLHGISNHCNSNRKRTNLVFLSDLVQECQMKFPPISQITVSSKMANFTKQLRLLSRYSYMWKLFTLQPSLLTVKISRVRMQPTAYTNHPHHPLHHLPHLQKPILSWSIAEIALHSPRGSLQGKSKSNSSGK